MDTKHLKQTAILCWLGWIIDFYDLILIAFLIPAIETSLNIDSHTSVWLIGIGLGASGIGGILFGWLSDLYGRKRMLTITVTLFSIGMFATAFTTSASEFLVARFITGIGLGGEWAIGHAIVAESTPKETRARWGAFLQSGEPIGVALSAVMGFIVAPYIGWRAVFIISSFAGLIVLFFRRYLKESKVWLQNIPTVKTWNKNLFYFLREYKSLMLLGFVLAVLKLGTYWTCYTWLPRFISESYGEAIGKSALWILCGQVGQFLGMYLFGFVADYIGRRFAFTVFSFLTSFVLLLLALFWHALFSQQILLFWLLIFLLGFGSGCTPGFGTLLAEIFPNQYRTLAMGSVYNLARGVQIFSPYIVGLAVERAGLTGGLLVPTLLAFLTGMWVWLLPERRAKPLPTNYTVED